MTVLFTHHCTQHICTVTARPNLDLCFILLLLNNNRPRLCLIGGYSKRNISACNIRPSLYTTLFILFHNQTMSAHLLRSKITHAVQYGSLVFTYLSKTIPTALDLARIICCSLNGVYILGIHIITPVHMQCFQQVVSAVFTYAYIV